MKSKPEIELLAFDADDTLWVNETIYLNAEEKLAGLIRPYLQFASFTDHLYQMETRNLEIFGYGIKGFLLSMIETAIELTSGRITGQEIQQIIALGKEMLAHPVELLPHVREAVIQLSAQYELMIITKGDLFDQENKIARSGLADFFHHIEIVSEKDEQTYAKLLNKYQVKPEHFLMVGNSLKSDILPVLTLGGYAVHIPFQTTWQHEQVHESAMKGYAFLELKDMGQLLAVLAQSFQLRKRAQWHQRFE